MKAIYTLLILLIPFVGYGHRFFSISSFTIISINKTDTDTHSVTAEVTAKNTPTKTVTPTLTQGEIPKALLFIVENSNNNAFATYMESQGSTFFGFGFSSVPQSAADITTFMDWPGFFDGTAPSVIEAVIPQTAEGVDSFGNTIYQYNFVTTKVPIGTVSGAAWYYWLIPQSQLGLPPNRQLSIGYNINSNPNGLINVDMAPTIYQYGGNYSGTNWPADTYRMYSTYANTAFNISNNNIDDLYFKGNFVTSVGIEEHTTNKQLLKVTDLFGRETKQTNQLLFYIYDDGSVEKKVIIE
jgi:hypothetical protein